MIRLLTTLAMLALSAASSGCAAEAHSRQELAENGLDAIRDNDASRYRDFLVTLPKLREHCSEAELHRAMLAIPKANESLNRAIKQCHQMADWSKATLVSLRGGDVYEHALECGGRFARMSSIVATYVIAFERYEVHHRRGYLKDGSTYLVSRQPWCTRQ